MLFNTRIPWKLKLLLSSDGDPWKFSGFYGYPEVAKRQYSWTLLLASLIPVLWLCLGDFNEILSLGEKSSRSYRSKNQMEAFQHALDDCNLLDLGFIGPKYTWCNGRMATGITR
jgi:hypothetical protein